MEKSLTLADYEALAELRYQIRRFLHFSNKLPVKRGWSRGSTS